MFLFGSEERDLQTLILDQKYLGISWSVLANAPPTIKNVNFGPKILGNFLVVLVNTPPLSTEMSSPSSLIAAKPFLQISFESAGGCLVNTPPPLENTLSEPQQKTVRQLF